MGSEPEIRQRLAPGRASDRPADGDAGLSEDREEPLEPDATGSPGVFSREVPPEACGLRLDRFLAEWLEGEGLSRARLQSLIQEGRVAVEGSLARASLRLRGGEQVRVQVPAARPTGLVAQDIPLEVLFEDAALLVIHKPSGLVVHPARGSEDGTLVNALLHRQDDLSGIGGQERPGIVHRLDRDTSGVLVVAKTDVAHRGLSEQFQVHSIRRCYRALVRGLPPRQGTWQSGLGRNPHNRLKMMSLARGGRHAITHWERLEAFDGASLLELTLETGRTHQIRVHCSEAGFPILLDPVYGGHWQRGLPDDRALQAALEAAGRQMLHARLLEFTHPVDGRRLELVAEPPPDFQRVLQALRDAGTRGAGRQTGRHHSGQRRESTAPPATAEVSPPGQTPAGSRCGAEDASRAWNPLEDD